MPDEDRVGDVIRRMVVSQAHDFPVNLACLAGKLQGLRRIPLGFLESARLQRGLRCVREVKHTIEIVSLRGQLRFALHQQQFRRSTYQRRYRIRLM